MTHSPDHAERAREVLEPMLRQAEWRDAVPYGVCTQAMLAYADERVAAALRGRDTVEAEPFAYFQRNESWDTWEQVADEHKDAHEGIVAAYRRPHQGHTPMTDPAAIAAGPEVSIIAPVGWRTQAFWAARKGRVFGIVVAFSPSVLALGIEAIVGYSRGIAIMVGPLWIGFATARPKHLLQQEGQGA